MKLSELESRLVDVEKDMTTMLDARGTSGQEFTDEENTRFKALAAEKSTLRNKIDVEKEADLHRRERALNSAGKDTPEQKVAKQFSWARAIEFVAKGKQADGLEGEMSKEAEREARTFGQSIDGLGVPSMLVNVKGKNVYGQTRDLTAGGTGTGLEYVESLEKMHQFGLEIAPKAFQLGVTVWTGLTSNIYVTETGEASAVWETEVATADETTPATSRPVSLSPKRLAAFTDISKQLLLQRSIADQIVKTQLEKAKNRKLDHTIFQGTGVSPIPTGIDATANVNSFASGGVPSRQTFIDMWAMLAADNSADLGQINVATTSAIYAFLEGAYLDAGSGRFVLENGKVRGHDVLWSNNVAANTILMGDFSQFVVGQWGGYDLLVNPYTKGKEAIIEVIINSFFDMGCLRPTAFVKATDVTLV
jgi:hypothetical protein